MRISSPTFLGHSTTLEAGTKCPHHIGYRRIHVVHAVDIQPGAPKRLGRPRRVAPFQRVQRRRQLVPPMCCAPILRGRARSSL